MSGFKLPAWRITSPFGMRVNPVTGVRKLHAGTDFGASSGTPIKAIAPGVVSAKGANLDKRTGFGYWVAIKQYDGSKGVYAHLREPSALSVGTSVDHNTTVGNVGSTGASTGPHLHYQLEVNGTPVDPVPYANARPVPKPGPAPAPAPSGTTYVIQRGDTLGSIAAKYGIKWQDLYAANRGVIGANPNRIFSGQVLTIPVKSAPAPAKPAPAKPSGPIIHVVRSGDTLSKIANRYGKNWKKIYQDNRRVIGANPNNIFPGQKLVIN